MFGTALTGPVDFVIYLNLEQVTMTSSHFKILTVLKIAIGCDVLPYRDGLAPDIINYCVDEVDKDEYLR